MNTNIGPWVPVSFVEQIIYNKSKNLTEFAKEFIPIKNLEGENS